MLEVVLIIWAIGCLLISLILALPRPSYSPKMKVLHAVGLVVLWPAVLPLALLGLNRFARDEYERS